MRIAGTLFFLALLWAAPASAVVSHSGTINAHTTWSADHVHRITGNVTVATGVVLTIEQGAVIEFDGGRSLTVNGALEAIGTSANPIIFTSYRDAAGQAEPGDWGRITFTSTVTDSLTRLEHVQVRYGGAGGNGSVYFNGSSAALVDSVIRDSASHGVHVVNGSPTLRGNTIEGSASHGVYLYRSSTSHPAAAPLLEDNVIRASGGDGGQDRTSVA